MAQTMASCGPLLCVDQHGEGGCGVFCRRCGGGSKVMGARDTMSLEPLGSGWWSRWWWLMVVDGGVHSTPSVVCPIKGVVIEAE